MLFRSAVIVHRDVPLGDRHFGVHRDDEGLRKDDVRRTAMGLALVDPAQRAEADAVISARDRDLGPVDFAQHLRDRQVGIERLAAELLAVVRRRVLVFEIAVQERGMCRVDADLQRLQPVAVPVALEGEGVGARRREAVEVRKRGRLPGAEPGKEDAEIGRASCRERV